MVSGNQGIGFAPGFGRPDQFVLIYLIGTMRPVGTPIIPAISIQYGDLGSMHHPQRSTGVPAYLKRLKRKQAIM
jgi:hypothetical protein